MPKTHDPSAEYRRQKVVEAVLAGMTTHTQIAKYAGYEHPRTVGKVLQRPDVQKQIAEGQSKAIAEAVVTRERVQNIVLDAIDMAKMQAVPGDMIRGAQELNKMNGFYAPERKEHELGEKTRELLNRFEAMSDLELLEAIDHDIHPIEAEFEVIENGE